MLRRLDAWTAIRYLHVLALAFFVGGQLLLVVAVVPAMRRHGSDEATREVAKRFGMGTGVALAVLIATGSAMATHLHLWGSHTLQLKLGLLVLVFALTGVHVVAPKTRWLSLAVLAVSLVIVWLGVKLAHG